MNLNLKVIFEWKFINYFGICAMKNNIFKYWKIILSKLLYVESSQFQRDHKVIQMSFGASDRLVQ